MKIYFQVVFELMVNLVIKIQKIVMMFVQLSQLVVCLLRDKSYLEGFYLIMKLNQKLGLLNHQLYSMKFLDRKSWSHFVIMKFRLLFLWSHLRYQMFFVQVVPLMFIEIEDFELNFNQAQIEVTTVTVVLLMVIVNLKTFKFHQLIQPMLSLVFPQPWIVLRSWQEESILIKKHHFPISLNLVLYSLLSFLSSLQLILDQVQCLKSQIIPQSSVVMFFPSSQSRQIHSKDLVQLID